jgi:hypothetical protein
VNRSTLATLGLGFVLAASACGRYGPPIRSIDPAASAPEPGAGAESSAPDDRPPGQSTIETFEDEPIP